jgi:hypothetical protein
MKNENKKKIFNFVIPIFLLIFFIILGLIIFDAGRIEIAADIIQQVAEKKVIENEKIFENHELFIENDYCESHCDKICVTDAN